MEEMKFHKELFGVSKLDVCNYVSSITAEYSKIIAANTQQYEKEIERLQNEHLTLWRETVSLRERIAALDEKLEKLQEENTALKENNASAWKENVMYRERIGELTGSGKTE